MSHMQDIPAGICFSGTEESNSYYQQFIPNTFIHGSFHLPTFKRFVATQRKVARLAHTGKFEGCPDSFCLMDDCLYDKALTKFTEIREMFMNGRHWKLLVLLTMQYSLDMGPDLRANVDYVFVLRENILSNRERLWKYWFGLFPTFQGFCKAMDVCTADFGALVVDNTVNSTNIEDCVFWYKARLGVQFRMGAQVFWDFHNAKFNERFEEDAEETEETAAKKAQYRVSKIGF
jgi:hypothetical protein